MKNKRRRMYIVLITILTIIVVSFVAFKVMDWKTFPGSVQGQKIEGDATASPTTWWNHLYMAKWGWKTVTVFEVTEEDALIGYQVGYKPFEGDVKADGKKHHDRRFRLKIGHEDCTFFAATLDGTEVPITVVTRTTKDDAAYQDAPLL
ncbi:MAG: hypothetical protein ABIO72_06010 [Patescibacteria group bacterium]